MTFNRSNIKVKPKVKAMRVDIILKQKVIILSFVFLKYKVQIATLEIGTKVQILFLLLTGTCKGIQLFITRLAGYISNYD